MIGSGPGRISRPLDRLRTTRPGWSGPTKVVTQDRQRAAIADRDHERARRALWADCERRPMERDFA